MGEILLNKFFLASSKGNFFMGKIDPPRERDAPRYGGILSQTVFFFVLIFWGGLKYFYLRIMGSQNWWFGDARSLSQTPLFRRVAADS